MKKERKYLPKEYKDKLGSTCVNCGSSYLIEYHHIVPLHKGGTDRLSNIVPLCCACHKAVHNTKHISEYSLEGHCGRKRLAKEEDVRVAFKLYVNGEIGTKKCKTMLGYRHRGSVNDIPGFVELKAEYGIKKMRNNIDVMGTNSPERLVDGAPCGRIVYEDGRIEIMHFHDSGLNDVTYTLRVQ